MYCGWPWRTQPCPFASKGQQCASLPACIAKWGSGVWEQSLGVLYPPHWWLPPPISGRSLIFRLATLTIPAKNSPGSYLVSLLLCWLMLGDRNVLDVVPTLKNLKNLMSWWHLRIRWQIKTVYIKGLIKTSSLYIIIKNPVLIQWCIGSQT